MIEQWLRESVADQVIYHCNADCRSTLTTTIVYKRFLYVASVGDSRAYHYNANNGLRRLTTDHTIAANLVEAGLLQPDEVSASPKSKQHYRYLGQKDHIAVDLFHAEVAVGDLILLCTDGLWRMLPRTIEQEQPGRL
jgi:serine/threonine protein phosphatase PrpC